MLSFSFKLDLKNDKVQEMSNIRQNNTKYEQNTDAR